jgi:hypothetical protein
VAVAEVAVIIVLAGITKELLAMLAPHMVAMVKAKAAVTAQVVVVGVVANLVVQAD